MMKRILCILLASVLMIGVWNKDSVAYGYQNETVKDTLELSATEYSEIYVDENGNYYFVEDNSNEAYSRTRTVSQSAVYPVEKVDIDFENESSIQQVMNTADLPDAVKEDIYDDYQRSLTEEGYHLDSGVLFIPDSVTETTSSSTSYHYEGNTYMRCILYNTSGSDVKAIATGTSTLAKLNAAKDIALYLYKGGFSQFSQYINLLLNGATLLSNFCILLGVNVVDVIASSKDSWKDMSVKTLGFSNLRVP